MRRHSVWPELSGINNPVFEHGITAVIWLHAHHLLGHSFTFDLIRRAWTTPQLHKMTGRAALRVLGALLLMGGIAGMRHGWDLLFDLFCGSFILLGVTLFMATIKHPRTTISGPLAQ